MDFFKKNKYCNCDLVLLKHCEMLHSSDFSDCKASFNGRFKLREHMRSHTQEKLVACPSCGGMFANNTKFFDHIRRQTSLEGDTTSL